MEDSLLWSYPMVKLLIRVLSDMGLNFNFCMMYDLDPATMAHMLLEVTLQGSYSMVQLLIRLLMDMGFLLT